VRPLQIDGFDVNHQDRDAGAQSADVETRMSGDGSTTLYSRRFGQHYHNPNGALRESLHVFFRPLGLIPALSARMPVSIFETGFGTGLNFLLLLHRIRSLQSTSPVVFHSVEAHPAPVEAFNTQNHAARLGLEALWRPVVEMMGSLEKGWNLLEVDGTVLHLFHGRLEEIESLPGGPSTVDAIFHDPFSPDVNPECWTMEAFARLRAWADPACTLRTYSASSAARAAMAHAGWSVARHPGALGKREMTLASPSPDALRPYPLIDLERLKQRFPMPMAI
jgi:tRNA U34 5-methylaminomethyl-2-thiouridine-forming methyltransferase MnmC